MFGKDCNRRRSSNLIWKDDQSDISPKAKDSTPVTPKMLVKALKKLKKYSVNQVMFTPKEVVRQILCMYPAVEQNVHALLLEVSDKLICAAAAGLLGTKQDLVYYAFEAGREGASTKSELIFWLYYKKLLKKQEKECEQKVEVRGHQLTGCNAQGTKKIVRLMSFSDDHLHFFPFVQYRRKIKQQT